jgi:hypothetical protein
MRKSRVPENVASAKKAAQCSWTRMPIRLKNNKKNGSTVNRHEISRRKFPKHSSLRLFLLVTSRQKCYSNIIPPKSIDKSIN